MAKDNKGLSLGCVSMIGLMGVIVVPLLVVPASVVMLFPGAQWRPDASWPMFVAVAVAIMLTAAVIDSTVVQVLAHVPGPERLHTVMERGVEALIGSLLLSLLMRPYLAALLTAVILETIAAVAEPMLERLENNASD